jgi:hypothetical protein
MATKRKPKLVPSGLEPYARQAFPELSYLTSYAVGHAVSVYWLGLGGPGSKGCQYQVMRATDGPGEGYDFWKWHSINQEPFFDSPEAACVAYVESYRNWMRTVWIKQRNG